MVLDILSNTSGNMSRSSGQFVRADRAGLLPRRMQPARGGRSHRGSPSHVRPSRERRPAFLCQPSQRANAISPKSRILRLFWYPYFWTLISSLTTRAQCRGSDTTCNGASGKTPPLLRRTRHARRDALITNLRTPTGMCHRSCAWPRSRRSTMTQPIILHARRINRQRHRPGQRSRRSKPRHLRQAPLSSSGMRLSA